MSTPAEPEPRESGTTRSGATVTAPERGALEERLRYYGLWTDCRAGRDGDCTWIECPQLNPKTAERHCPLDKGGEGE